MAIEFVYYDLGNVLLFFDYHQAARQMAEVAGVTPEVVWKAVFEDGLLESYEQGIMDGPHFYQAFCELTGSEPDYEALEQAGSEMFRMNTTILPVLHELATSGYRLGVMSNTCASHWEYVSGRYEFLRRVFETFVLSFEVGALKPDAKIYHAAIDKAGVPAGSILFIDDRPENVAGAQKAGLVALHYADTLQLDRELRKILDL